MNSTLTEPKSFSYFDWVESQRGITDNRFKEYIIKFRLREYPTQNDYVIKDSYEKVYYSNIDRQQVVMWAAEHNINVIDYRGERIQDYIEAL